MNELSSILIRAQALSVNQITRALQRQVIYGGDLSTNLLELDLLDEPRVVEYTASAFGLKQAAPVQMADVPQAVLRSMPRSLVEDHRVLPLRHDGKNLVLAVSKPLEKRALSQISSKTGCEIEQFITSGFRLAMWLNRYYGVALPARFATLQRKYEPSFAADQPPLVPAGEFEGIDEDEINIPTAPAQPQKGSVEQSQIINVGALTKQKTPKLATPPASAPAPKRDAASTSQRIHMTAKHVETAQAMLRGTMAPGETRSPLSPKAPEKPQVASRAPATPPAPPVKTGGAVGAKAIPPKEPQTAEIQAPSDDVRATRVGAGTDVGAKAVAVPQPPPQKREPTQRIATRTAYDGDGAAAAVPVQRVSGPISFSDAKKQLEGAVHREQIFDVAIGFLSQLFDYMAMFQVHGSEAQGRVAALADQGVFGIDNIALPLGAEGILTTVLNTRAIYLGPPIRSEFDRDLMSRLERTSPNCAVIPVLIGGRVALLIYGDRGKRKISSRRVSDISRFTARMGAAFMRLVLEQKSRVARPSFVGADVPPVPSRIDATLPRVDRSSAPAAPVVTQPPGVIVEPLDDSEDLDDAEELDLADAEVIGDIMDGSMDGVDSLPPISAAPAGPLSVVPVDVDNLPDDHSNLVLGDAESGISLVSSPPPSMSTASELSSERLHAQRVYVQMDEELGRLVERVLSPGPFDTAAADLLVGIGDDALARLIPLFPGPLRHDTFTEDGRLRPVIEHGPMFKILVRFGHRAVPYLLPLLEHSEQVTRYYTTFLFSDLIYPEVVGPLTSRLFDFEPSVRNLAVEVLKLYTRFPEYRFAVRNVLDMLAMPSIGLVVLRTAAEVLGDLRDRSSVPSLTRLLGHEDPELQRLAHRALRKVTFCDEGSEPEEWRDWWNKNRDRHRIEWAISGLSAKEEFVRADAASELRRMASGTFEWPGELAAGRKYTELTRRINDWWSREGRLLHPVADEY